MCAYQVFLFQKAIDYKCNMVRKPSIITYMVDNMTDNLRPTCAEETEMGNVVLDGMYGPVVAFKYSNSIF